MTRSESRIKPGYAGRFARSSAQSANPHLWRGLVSAWCAPLGETGFHVHDPANKISMEMLGTSPLPLWYTPNLLPPSNGYLSHPEWCYRLLSSKNHYLEAPADNRLNDFTHGVTLVQRFYRAWADGTNAGHFESSVGDSVNSRFLLFHYSDDNLYWRVVRTYGLGGTSTALSVANPCPVDEWSHLACSYKNLDSRIYHNGDVVASTSALGGNIDTGSGKSRIGQLFTGGYFLDGFIAETYVYNRVLTQNEIRQLYADGLAPFRLRNDRSAATSYVPGNLSLITGYQLATIPRRINTIQRVDRRDPLSQGLVAWWPDGRNDVAGRQGVADLNGSSSPVEIGTADCPTGSRSLTFASDLRIVNYGTGQELFPKADEGRLYCAWVKLDSTSAEYQEVFLFDDSNTYPRILLDLASKPIIQGNNSNYQYFTADATTALHDDKWHHVAFWFAGTDLTDMLDCGMWMDGSPVAKYGATSQGNAPAPFDKLASGGASYGFEGEIADIRVYNRKLPDAVMKQLYDESRRGYPSQYEKMVNVGGDFSAAPPATFNHWYARGARHSRIIGSGVH